MHEESFIQPQFDTLAQQSGEELPTRTSLSLADPRELAYPVLCLRGDGRVLVKADCAELEHGRAADLWRLRSYRSMHLFDATATPYTVARAVPYIPLSSGKTVLTRLLNRPLRLKLTLHRLGPPSLTLVKRMLLESLARDTAGRQRKAGFPHPAQVSACASMIELVGLFSRGQREAGAS